MTRQLGDIHHVVQKLDFRCPMPTLTESGDVGGFNERVAMVSHKR